MTPFEAHAMRLAGERKTPVYVGTDGELAGMIAVADPLQPTTAEAIARMRRMGLDIVLLTGDNQRTAPRGGARPAVADRPGRGGRKHRFRVLHAAPATHAN